MDKTLKRALHKSRHFKGREYCGYLTYPEMQSLIDSGARLEESSKSHFEWHKKESKEGKTFQTWYYFLPPKGLVVKANNHGH